MRNNAIGVALRVSESTVEFHVSNILAKLGAATRTEAVDRATALGMYWARGGHSRLRPGSTLR